MSCTRLPQYTFEEVKKWQIWPAHPFLVTEIPKDERTDFSIKDLQRVFADATFDIYAGDDYNWQEAPAAPHLEKFAAGEKVPNLFQQDIHDENIRKMYKVPEFLCKNNLLHQHAEKDIADGTLCLVMTPAGAYTELHWDSYGYGGWMYLSQGVKRWELMDASMIPAFWDPVARRLYDPINFPVEKSGPGKEALAGMLAHAPRWQGTLAAGQLLYFPPGTMHRVWTDEISIGYGGSIVRGHDADKSVRIWLLEHSLGVAMAWNLNDVFGSCLEAWLKRPDVLAALAAADKAKATSCAEESKAVTIATTAAATAPPSPQSESKAAAAAAESEHAFLRGMIDTLRAALAAAKTFKEYSPEEHERKLGGGASASASGSMMMRSTILDTAASAGASAAASFKSPVSTAAVAADAAAMPAPVAATA